MFNNTQYNQNPFCAAAAPANERASFIKKTYFHLALAILGLAGIEWALLNTQGIESLIAKMIGGQYSWLIVLGLFMGVSWLADSWARSSASRGLQYAGLALYVVAEAFILLPILFIAQYYDPSAILYASGLTLILFGALTLTAFTSNKDFSFLRGILSIGGLIALGAIVGSIFFGFTLGWLFSLIMAGFASIAILYYTSQVMHHYNPDQYVAASLSLFASVALLFFYILNLLMRRD